MAVARSCSTLFCCLLGKGARPGEYDEGDDAFDALFDGGSGYGWDSPSGGGAFF